MDELTRNGTLNEDIYKSLPEKQRAVLIYQWLCYLDENNICHWQIIEELLQQMFNISNPPTRILIGRNLVRLLTINNQSTLLIKTIHHCRDCLRMNNETTQLTAVVVIGVLYEHLSRFLDRSFEEIIEVLLQLLQNKNSQMRCEILTTLEHMINGLGPISRSLHRDIYHQVKTHLNDRAIAVRSAATLCLTALIHHNNFMYTSELDGNLTLGLRAFQGSNYQVRCAVAKYLAILLATFQSLPSDRMQSMENELSNSVMNTHQIKMEKMLNYLAKSFLYLKPTIAYQGQMKRTAQNEVRIGISYTYLSLIHVLGTTWVEQQLSLLINHLLELVDNPQLSISHLESIFIRKCITLILRSLINSCSHEKAQSRVAKELMTTITRYTIVQPMVNSSTVLINDLTISLLYSSTNSMIQSYGSTTTNRVESCHIDCHGNVLICALQELSLLIHRLETSTLTLLQDNCNGLIDTLFSLSLHSLQSVRFSVAWCFRSIAIALPSLMTQLIDQCWEKISEVAKEINLSNTDSISGFALVLQALLGAVHQCCLGIPSERVSTIFDFADHLLRTVISSTVGQEQSIIPRLILQRTSTAWHLLSACCTIDLSLRKKFLPRLILLWRNAFPRSLADFEREKQRGDCLTWLLSFNQRTGALCSMISFLNNCLIAKENSLFIDLLPPMINPLDNAIVMLFQISQLTRQFGQQLKTATTIFRLRLYELILLIPSQFYERHSEQLGKELITEFTLVDNASNITTTSLLKSICHDFLDHGLEDTDHQSIEEQLNPHFSNGYGALEHDETCLYRPDYSHSMDFHIPEPLPVYIAVIDASIQLYSRIFAHLSNVQRLIVLQSFTDAIKQSKDARQEAIQINILIALLLSLKVLTETEQVTEWDDDLKKSTCTFIIQALNHSVPEIRCIAAEAFGHLIRILTDKSSISSTIQLCLDHLKESGDTSIRIGYSLAFACAYRCSDNISKRQYLNLFIPIFQTMLEDQSRTSLQIWALRGLNLIADASEDMNSNYIGSLIDRILQIILCKSSSQVEIFRCCGRLLNTLILNMGSDLQTNTNSISKIRTSCLTAINLLQMHMEPVIQAEAIQALQVMYISAPEYVHLSMLIQKVIQGLTSPNLVLRQACISALCHLSRREAKQVHEHAKLLFNSDSTLDLRSCRNLEELLFSLLDTETETNISLSIKNVLVNIIQILENDDLSFWLQLCNDILALDQSKVQKSSSDDHEEDDVDSNNPLPTTSEQNRTYHRRSFIKWSTKIFAIHCIENIIKHCEQTTQSNLHSNSCSSAEYLLVHFPVFISSSILACTSKHDSLRLAGFSLLKQIVFVLTRLEETADSTTHLILKQYQRQIGAALRPAFSRRTSSHVTTQACDICWIWISSQLVPDLHDLRRIHQILLSSLQKLTSLQEQYSNQANMIYHETAITMENLAILKLWADIYIFVTEQGKEKPVYHLLELIEKELYILIHHWLAVLTDYASLILSTQFHHQTKNLYFIESIRTISQTTWSSILKAAIQWLTEHRFELELSPTNHQLINYGQRDVLMVKLLTSTNKTRRIPEKKEENFILLLTCCIHTLSVSTSEQTDETIEIILTSLLYLLQSEIAFSQINVKISSELIDVLHRLCSVRTDRKTQLRVLKLIDLILIAQKDSTVSVESLLLTFVKFIVSIFVNYFPTITDNLQLYTRSVDMDQDTMKNSHIIDFLLSVLQLLDHFIQLFSISQNFQKVFSVIIHLLLSISYVLLSSNSDQQQLLLSPLFQIMENLFHTPTNNKISHNAMMEIITFRDKLLERNLSDHGYFLRCLTSLIINCNTMNISKQILDFYQTIFQDADLETHRQCLQCLEQLFQSKTRPLRDRFIRKFSPLLFLELKQTSDPQEITQILKIFEKLLFTVDTSSRLHLASVIIPIFIHFLPDSTSSNVQTNDHLMLYIIERLQHLSSVHPNEFSSVLQRSPHLQPKVTKAIATPISSAHVKNN